MLVVLFLLDDPSNPEHPPQYFSMTTERKLSAEDALREIEWQAHGHFCYVCAQAKCDGHSPECPVGIALSNLAPSKQ